MEEGGSGLDLKPGAGGPRRGVSKAGLLMGPNWVTARLDDLVNWSRANSLWPASFFPACCAIEFMATAASRYDLARFGMERLAYSPRQADALICAGRVPFKLAPVLRRIWDQMPQPKWCISVGACASTGGVFDTYAVVQGIDQFLPVDVYVPGCPPRPETLLEGLMLIQRIVTAAGVKTSQERGSGLRLTVQPPRQRVETGAGFAERE